MNTFSPKGQHRRLANPFFVTLVSGFPPTCCRFPLIVLAVLHHGAVLPLFRFLPQNNTQAKHVRKMGNLTLGSVSQLSTGVACESKLNLN